MHILIRNTVEKTSKLILSPLFRLWVKRAYGLSKIPQKGGAIVAANHESYFDFLLLSAVIKRDIRFIAAEKFFKSRFWKPIMEITKQIRVDRYTTIYQEEAISKAVGLLRNGNILGVFPEGTRSKNGKLQKAFYGVIKIALIAKVPIFPVGLRGTKEILSKDRKIPTFKRCTINFGDPIYLSQYYEQHYQKDILKNMTNLLMHKISDLTSEEYLFAKRRPYNKIDSKGFNGNVVFFDVDKTIIDVQCQQLFIKYLRKKKRISGLVYSKLILFFSLYKIHLLPMVGLARRKGFSIVKGWSVEKSEMITEQFYEDELKSHILEQAKSTIEKHLQRGDLVVLFSTAWDMLLYPLSRHLGVKNLLSTRVKKGGGCFTGELLGSALYGKNKVAVAQRFLSENNLDNRNTIAYADHVSDIPLLEFVDQPVVINPDRRMSKIVERRGWQVKKWVKKDGY